MHRRGLPRAAFLAVVAALVAPPATARADATRVGVVVTLEINVERPRADKVAEAMGAALNRELVVDAVAGGEARRRLRADSPADDCEADPACLAEVARRLDADELLLLVLARVGDRVQIDTTWFDASTEEIASRPGIRLDAEEADGGAVFARYAQRLLPDARRRTQNVAAPAPQPSAGGERMIDAPRRMTPTAWIAAGAGAAALAGGVVFGLSARSDYSDIESACGGPCPTDHPRYGDLDSVSRRALTADILLGAALASGVTAAILYARSGGERRAVGATVGPGAVGISVGGRY